MHCVYSRNLFQAQILSNQRRETVLIHNRSTGGFTMFRFYRRHTVLAHVVGRSSLDLHLSSPRRMRIRRQQ